MTTIQPEQAREYCGHHVVWCTNHDDEFDRHSADEPYCSKLLGGVQLIPEGDAQKVQLWVSPTQAFTDGCFTPTEYAARERLYNSIEISIETWRGPEKGWDDTEKFRVSSDAARSLAAALVRAADIEQGLTR